MRNKLKKNCVVLLSKTKEEYNKYTNLYKLLSSMYIGLLEFVYKMIEVLKLTKDLQV